ncbi:hypothetical protein, partial [Corallococcus sp. 4LFB]|uniref:hypothetical protein n=1 Tax=Corallococcus sp. 4LFB TaxID=3383249 RepID=UPI003975ABC1
MPLSLADFLFQSRDVLQDAWLHEAPGSGNTFSHGLSAVAARMANPDARVADALARELSLLVQGSDGHPTTTNFRRLRDTVLRLWRERGGAGPDEEGQVERFHDAVDAVEAAA